MNKRAEFDEIQTRRIFLSNKEGKLKAIFDAASDGDYVSLTLFGGSGARMDICIDGDGNPKIGFVRKNGRDGVSIGCLESEAGITLSDTEGRPRFSIIAPLDEKEGVIRIVNEEGDAVWSTEEAT